jgi:hypothetical protein
MNEESCKENNIELKSKLFKIGALTNRGEFASERQKEEMIDIINNLEALNPSLSQSDQKFSAEGTWELVYTDSQLFMSSPFFLTILELFGSNFEKANEIFQLHRLAANTGEIGSVKQLITSDKLVSEVELRVGLIPGPPFSLKGKVITTADILQFDQFTLKLKLQGTRIKDSNTLLQTFFDNFELPLDKIYEFLAKDVPTPSLTTYYLDENLRITRSQDDRVFVYSRSS